MNRRDFLFSGLISAVSLEVISKELSSKKYSKAPAIFIGHGSPMNAIEDNEYSKKQLALGKRLAYPAAILVVSAHWETNGLFIQKTPKPKTIHDFMGFPKPLQEFNYAASGTTNFIDKTNLKLKNFHAQTTADWGLDHGAWSVLARLFPKANVPVFQLSINQNLSLKEHLSLARELQSLREQGLMILGSGNIVHNLRLADDTPNFKPYDWALEFDQWIQKKIYNRDINGIVNFEGIDKKVVMNAHPSLEHFIPFLYTLGASTDKDKFEIPIDGFQESAISMKSIIYS